MAGVSGLRKVSVVVRTFSFQKEFPAAGRGLSCFQKATHGEGAALFREVSRGRNALFSKDPPRGEVAVSVAGRFPMIGTSGFHKSSAAGTLYFQKIPARACRPVPGSFPRRLHSPDDKQNLLGGKLFPGINPCKTVSLAGGALNTKNAHAGAVGTGGGSFLLIFSSLIYVSI